MNSTRPWFQRLLIVAMAACACPAAAQTTITTSSTINSGTTYSTLTVGAGSSPGPTVTINNNAAITITTATPRSFNVGTSSNQYGSVVQESGTVSSNGGLYLGDNGAAGTYTGTSSYTLNGGSILLSNTANGLLVVGRNATGTLTQNGGLITTGRTNSFIIGPEGNGTYVITGGTYEATSSFNDSSFPTAGAIATAGGTGRLSINGANAVVAINGSNLEMASNIGNSATTKGSATVELLNGTLAVNGNVTRGRPTFGANSTGDNGPGAVTFTLGGGTLRPYNADLNVGITTAGTNNLAFDVTLAANTLSTITGVGWKSGSSHTVTMFSNLVGSGSLQVTGGTVVLDSAGNTYSGATTIAGTNATLRLSAAGSFGNSSTIRVGNAGSSGAVLDLTSKTSGFTFGSGQTVGGIGTLNIGAGRTVTSNGIWAPGNSIGSNAVTGNLTLTGTSQFELGTPGTSTTAPGLADFTAVSGTLTLGGALNLINNAGADGNGSAAGGVYRLFTYGNAVSGSYASVTTNPTATTRTSLGNISYGGSGTATGQGVFLSIYNLAAGNVTSGTSLNLGLIHAGGSFTSQAVSIGNTAAAGSFSEGLNASVAGSTGNATSGGTAITNLSAGGSASTITVNLGDTATGGVKNGTVTIDYQSNGATTSGLAAIAAGSQVVNLTGSVFSGTGTWNQAGGGSWGSQASNSWTSTGGVAAAPGTFIGYANTDAAIFGNAVASGTASIKLDGAQVSLASIKFDNATARYLIESGTGSGSFTLAAASVKPVVDVVGTHEIAAAINGTNGLEKTGLGKLILSGSSNYSGGTDISAGTLAVNGAIGGAVNVANAAILGGSGSINGLVTVAAGGILAPGNSPGTLTMNSGLVLDAASLLNFELDAANNATGGGINDLISVTGNFTLAGILNVTGLGDFSTVADNTKWRLFKYTGGTFTDGGLTLGTMPSVGSTGKYFQIDTATPGQVNLVIVPEPGAIALAGIGIAAAAWALRSRSPSRKRAG